jgi:hypothetical protein
MYREVEKAKTETAKPQVSGTGISRKGRLTVLPVFTPLEAYTFVILKGFTAWKAVPQESFNS